MKRRAVMVTLMLTAFSAVSVVAASAAGGPEEDGASATFSLTSKDAVLKGPCTGEDGGDLFYTTSGTWSGPEQEFPVPNSTDYTLVGVLTYKASLTVDLGGYGVMTGTATLKAAPIIPGGRPGTKLYSGPLTIVFNPLGAGTQNQIWIGRGLLDAKAFLNGAVDGSVIANVEAQGSDYALSHLDGRFGIDTPAGAMPSTPDYSAATNWVACP